MFVSPSAEFRFRSHFVTQLIYPHCPFRCMEVDKPSRQEPGLWRFFNTFSVLTHFADIFKFATVRFVTFDVGYCCVLL